MPAAGGTSALNAVTGDPFLDGIIQNRLSHMSSTAQGFVDTANTITDVAVGFTNVGSAYEAIMGETASGRPLDVWERGLAGVSVALPPFAFVARMGGNAVEGAAAARGLATHVETAMPNFPPGAVSTINVGIPRTSIYFPTDPKSFNPAGGLIRTEYKNGEIIKWSNPKTNKALYEWNLDAKGGHYHITPDGKNRVPHPVTGDTHIPPGMIVPNNI